MKSIVMMLIGSLLVSCLFLCTSCTKDEMEMISYQAGKYSMIAWLSFDNPSVNTKEIMTEVVKVIKTESANIQTNETFSSALYVKVCDIIDNDEKITELIKPVVKAGALVLLNGIDLFMIDNPKWSKTTEDIVLIANSFCSGAISTLELPETNKMIIQTHKAAKLRAKLIEK